MVVVEWHPKEDMVPLGAPAKLQAETAVIVQALWLKAHNFPKENE